MEIIGHTNMKKQLEVAIEAANKRNMALPHMLFSGAAGCGKTSSANYIANKINATLLSIVPNDLKDYRSVVKALSKLNHENYDSCGNRIGTIQPTVMFLDEVHNLPIKGQELLGLVMERFMIEASRPNKYHWVPFFTLIGATTLAGKLSKPFRDRFKLVFNFQPYSLEEMLQIVVFHARRTGIRCTPSGVNEIAKRSRGTPRIAVGYVERVRDRMLVYNSKIATSGLIKDMFEELGVDEEGLTNLEERLLKILIESDVPVSLDNLSVMLQEDSKSIKDFAEPYLIRKGLILVSGRGRVITELGRQHLRENVGVKRLIKEEIDFNYVRR